MHRLARLAAAVLLATPVIAAPADIPEALKPWVPWVLHGHAGELCPAGPEGAPRCAWPGRLELILDDRGGRMTQSWDVLADGQIVPLPGDADHLPLDATLDGRPAAVTLVNGVPSMHINAGAGARTHAIAASFEWSALPEWLAIPAETGLVSLTLRGARVAIPQRDQAGLLWLAARATERTEADSLQLAVHRLITDDVPLFVTTRLLFEVAGTAREAVLGPALPEGAIPVSLSSPLPARLEADGRLRVQLRAGSWVVTILSRQPGPVSELAPPQADPWAPDEVWSFQARPDLRVVATEGLPALDPSQTAIPAEWRSLPTFKATRGETLRLIEKRRGDAEPGADGLMVQRTLWLDFDGNGITAQDQLSGTLRRSWRLHMREPFQLARVQVSGNTRMLTRLSPGGPSGFEIREGYVNALAESRLEGTRRVMPAGGWDADLENLAGALNLPPGWRLLHAPGVDQASGSWLDSWTLLDLFLALIVAAAAARIWGKGIGALALATLVLTLPEPGSLRWSWLILLAFAGIEKMLAEDGRARSVLAVLRMITAGVLAILAIPFMVQQARQALHPQLEQPWGMGGMSQGYAGMAEEHARKGSMDSESDMAVSNAAPMTPPRENVMQREIHDTSEIVQVGAGVPTWTWRRHELQWSGPVTRDQEMRFVLLPPILMRLLSALTVVLLMALLVRGLLPPERKLSSLLGRLRRTRAAAPAVTALVVALLASFAPAARAQVPPPEILDELRTRALQRPRCEAHGDCVSIARLFVEVNDQGLRLRLKVIALADTAVALPGSASQWTPQQVLVDGRPASGIIRAPDDTLRLLVTEGSHDVELAGPLVARDTIGLTLPEHPAHAEVRADGWLVAGITDGVAAETLQLSRLSKDDGATRADGTLAPVALPPFVRVSRRIDLGLRWQARTSVTVPVPTASPVVLEIPLMPGESVTTAGIVVKDGKVLVNLAPGSPSLTWDSALAETDALVLVATQTTAWSEDWSLVASPRWHAEWTGVPPVHPADTSEVRVPQWRPWPGETLTIVLSRPEAAPGASLAITQSGLVMTPGKRATDATFDLTLLSSRGGDHVITLPGDATVSAVTVDGVQQPVRQEGARLTLPAAPGEHRVRLSWREARGISGRFKTSEIDLGIPSVNPSIQFTVPQDRWLLWVSGPVLGPAILFWPLLIVLVLLGIGLSRLRDIPLKLHDWVLLLIGLSQVPVAAGAAVVLWLLVLAWRKRHAPHAPPAVFDLAQIVVVAGALVSVGVLFAAINQGLLGSPDMQVQGNNSWGSQLIWTGDRAPGVLPQASVISAPLLVYRIAMLLWALWLAAALVRWLRWAWECFTEGGAWRRPFPKRAHRRQAPPPAPPEEAG